MLFLTSLTERHNMKIKVTEYETIAAQDFNMFRECMKAVYLNMVTSREPVEFDFEGYEPFKTVHFLHTLLFETVRLSWALRISPTYENATPSAEREIDFIEGYAVEHWKTMKMTFKVKPEAKDIPPQNFK